MKKKIVKKADEVFVWTVVWWEDGFTANYDGALEQDEVEDLVSAHHFDGRSDEVRRKLDRGTLSIDRNALYMRARPA